MKRSLVTLLLVVLASRVLAQGSLEPVDPQLGERGMLSLDTAPVDSTQWPRGLDVVLRATADPRRFEVVPVRVGEALIVLPATGDTLRWTVQPRIARAASDSLRPWQSVGKLGPNWWPTALGIATLLLLIAILVWRWRRSRPVPLELVILDPPHVIALRRFDEIEHSGLVAAGSFDEFYVRASHALREYVAGRFRVPALDWTTEETLRRLVASGYDRESVFAIDPLLQDADSVKFAAHRPSDHQADEWLRHARQWVQETAVEPVYTTAEALTASAELDDRRERRRSA